MRCMKRPKTSLQLNGYVEYLLTGSTSSPLEKHWKVSHYFEIKLMDLNEICIVAEKCTLSPKQEKMISPMTIRVL